MKKKKILGWLYGIPAIVAILIVIIVLNEPERDGISRASAYKSLALSMTTADVCRSQAEKEASYFPEKEKGQWYVKYMDYLYREGIIKEELTPPTEKTAEGWLTYQEVSEAVKAISEPLERDVKLTKQNRDKPFPKEQWWLLYNEILKITDPDGTVKQEAVQIYGTARNVADAPAWTAYTNLGTLRFEGLSLDSHIDHEIKALIRNEEIIRIIELISEEVIYRNTWVMSAGEEQVDAYVGSITREFPTLKNLKNPEELQNNVADLYISNGKLKKVVLKKEKISGKVLEVKEDSIEIEGYGDIILDENFNVYQIFGEFKRQKKSDILVGYDVQEFVVADGKLCAALTVREFEAELIRVLLMNTGFQSIFHDSITLKAEGPGIIISDQKEKSLNAGETITITPDDKRLKDGRIIIQLSDETKGIEVSSIQRSQGVPVYPGRIEIKLEEDGLVLVNELYMEDYLKRVVPSEMPGSYEKEALKAQAVCARTYAYRQIRSNGYRQYGAHVDDSTRFQVYNNTNTESSTDAAVNETYGKLLMYQGSPVEAYYFSTSSGHTTDGTIWGADLSSVPYLQAVALKEGGGALDLTGNEAFAEFIKDKAYPSYESGFAFYRWETAITSAQLAKKVPEAGTITKVTMKERGAGGIGKVMEIEGTEGTKVIQGQGQIRSILGNTELVITKNDKTTVTGWDTIPSAFVAIEAGEPDGDQVTTFRLYGGGYGHGVGMSQNGAQGMAKAGLNYKQILTFFFSGSEVK